MFDCRCLSTLIALTALACASAERRVEVASTPEPVSVPDTSEAVHGEEAEESAHAQAEVSGPAPPDDSEASGESASSANDEIVFSPVDEALCVIRSEWTGPSLRAREGGFVFGKAYAWQAQAAIGRHEGALRIDAELVRGGWRLFGRVDPDEDSALRTTEPSWLREGTVALRTDAMVRPLDARDGELFVTPWPFEEEQARSSPRVMHDWNVVVRFRAPVQGWVPCSRLGFSFPNRRSASEEMRALGFSESDGPVTLRPGHRVPIAERPGGTSFAELRVSREDPLTVELLERRGRHVRVRHTLLNGVLIAGWIPTRALLDEWRGLAGGGTAGANPRTGRWTVCTSRERLEVHAAEGDRPAERIGSVEPATPFLRLGEGPDGAIVVEPHPTEMLFVPDGVRWLVRPSAPLACAEDRYPPAVHVSAAVTTVSGLEGVAPGARCEVAVEHFTHNGRCRASVQCGDRAIGWRPSSPSHSFECQAATSGELRVRGTNQGRTEPTFTIDTRAGSLTIERTSGQDAFRLEARVESLRPGD